MLEHPKAWADYSGETGPDATMGNQQGTVSQAELGWLAGIVEGEGSITMNVRKKHWKGWNGVGVDMTVSIANTDGGIIERACDILRRLTRSEPRVHETGTSQLYRPDGEVYHNEQKRMLYISVNKMAHILRVLCSLEPHLAGEKSGRARLMIQFIERRLTRKGEHTKHGASHMDRYDWAVVADFYRLKRRPVPPEVLGLLNEHERDQLVAG